MALRVFTAFLVVLFVPPICFYAWFGMWFWMSWSVLGPGFGMPEYEEEVDRALLISLVVPGLVALFTCIKLCGYLNRRLPIPRLDSETPSDDKAH